MRLTGYNMLKISASLQVQSMAGPLEPADTRIVVSCLCSAIPNVVSVQPRLFQPLTLDALGAEVHLLEENKMCRP